MLLFFSLFDFDIVVFCLIFCVIICCCFAEADPDIPLGGGGGMK